MVLVRTVWARGAGAVSSLSALRSTATMMAPPERLLSGAVLVMLLPLFLRGFTAWKVAIPAFHPFAWDAALADFDLRMHGGIPPWKLTHIVESVPLTLFLDRFYTIGWSFVMVGVFIWQAFSCRTRLRMQFLLTFFVSWILIGILGALAFSSAGPLFYDPLLNLGPRFADLEAFLTEQPRPTIALNAAALLTRAYRDNHPLIAGGISAMPSMHIAIAALYTLVGWRTNRIAGVLLTLLAGVFLFSSVYLGWHYAVDGYASIVAVPLLWYGCGCFVRWWLPDA